MLLSRLDFRAPALKAGDERVVLLRADTIGMSGDIRRAIVTRLEATLGPEIDRQLIVLATHTHSGAGRLADNPFWEFIQDLSVLKSRLPARSGASGVRTRLRSGLLVTRIPRSCSPFLGCSLPS